MELFIDRICSKNLGPIIEKKIRKPSFPIIGDLKHDLTKTMTLNIKVPITKVYKKIYTCDRSLSDIVFLNDLDLRNVLLDKQPDGYNPIISDDCGKIYTLHKDFSIDTTFNIKIITPLSPPLYITYCEYYNPLRECTISSSLKYFTLTSGNPTFETNKLTADSLCSFSCNYVTCLYGTTIYIAILIKDGTSLLLTDSITNIKINNNDILITDGRFHTVPLLLKNTTYIFVCTISSSDILIYTYQDIPKSGSYYFYSVNSPITLTLEKCDLIYLAIYNELHSKNKMDHIISSLLGTYNL